MDAESTIYTKAAHRKKESRLNIGPWWCEGNVNDDGSDDEDLFSPLYLPQSPFQFSSFPETKNFSIFLKLSRSSETRRYVFQTVFYP